MGTMAEDAQVLRECADRIERLGGFGHLANACRKDADLIDPRPRFIGEIRPKHVGHSYLWMGDECVPVASAIGRVQERDIGKRVFRVGDVIQVENDEQRERRFKGE